MRLDMNGLRDKKFWERRGFAYPSFDILKATRATLAGPAWLHFGAGNIFRAFPAVMQQTLLENNHCDVGIIVIETYDGEIIDRAFAPYDNLSIAVTLPAKGEIKKKIVASVARAVAYGDAREEVAAYFTNRSLQIVSFTITEKGYALYGAGGVFLPHVAYDMENGPEKAAGVMGIVAALLYLRYRAGRHPLALLSMDNCSHNGDRIREAVCAFADGWAERGFTDEGFKDYVRDKNLVSYPLTMIDKITPSPSEKVRAVLLADGIEGMDISVTEKKSYAAPFVNAEETEYFVVEDIFPNGRPALERAGTIFTDRGTVDKVEKMKVCTCLNPLHTILAVFGLLLGYETIADEMNDPLLVDFIKRAGYDEGMPVVVDPGIIDPENFLREVIEARFPNPFVPDTPHRIAFDTSQKIPVRFGETLKAYINKGAPVDGLTYIPLFVAGWLRYLTGVGDGGEPFEPSPDPMLETLQEHLKGIKLGDKNIGEMVRPILSDKNIFGVDFYECGLGEKVERYFTEMLEGPGAVRRTLTRVVERY